MKTRSIRHLAWLITIGASLALPAAVSLFGSTSLGSPVTSPPPLPSATDFLATPKAYVRALDTYLEDSISLRSRMLEFNAALRVRFGSSASKEVVVGQSGWLFYFQGLIAPPGNDSDDWRARLKQQVRLLVALDEAVESLGARLVILPVPDKHNVYPEFLPGWLRDRRRPSKLAALAEIPDARRLAIVDLREQLANLKSQIPVYYRTDTHWTDLGALAAYNQIVTELGLGEHVLPLSLVAREDTLLTGDLAHMAQFAGRIPDWEVVPYESPTQDKEIRQDPSPTGAGPERGYEASRAGPGLRIAVIGDSFSQKFLREPLFDVASDILWIHHRWCKFDWERIRDWRPEVVIYQKVERYLGCSAEEATRLVERMGRVPGS